MFSSSLPVILPLVVPKPMRGKRVGGWGRGVCWLDAVLLCTAAASVLLRCVGAIFSFICLPDVRAVSASEPEVNPQPHTRRRRHKTSDASTQAATAPPFVPRRRNVPSSATYAPAHHSRFFHPLPPTQAQRPNVKDQASSQSTPLTCACEQGTLAVDGGQGQARGQSG